MKTVFVIIALLAFGVVSADAGKRTVILSTHTRIQPAITGIDERPASSLYQQNLRDSGYDAKNNFDKAGRMCASCDYYGN